MATLLIKTIARTSEKRYFLDGARISKRDALRLIEKNECKVEYR